MSQVIFLFLLDLVPQTKIDSPIKRYTSTTPLMKDGIKIMLNNQTCNGVRLLFMTAAFLHGKMKFTESVGLSVNVYVFRSSEVHK